MIESIHHGGLMLIQRHNVMGLDCLPVSFVSDECEKSWIIRSAWIGIRLFCGTPEFTDAAILPNRP